MVAAALKFMSLRYPNVGLLRRERGTKGEERRREERGGEEGEEEEGVK